MDRYPRLTGWLLVAGLIGAMWLASAVETLVAGPTP
jgi:hypothetical protein